MSSHLSFLTKQLNEDDVRDDENGDRDGDDV